MTGRPFEEAAPDRRFWEELCPELGIEGDREAPEANLAGLDGLEARLLFEGYFDAQEALPPELVRAMRGCLERLRHEGIPPVFAFVYDELWLAFRSLAPLLSRALGPTYRIRPCFWAWCIDPTEESSGWRPHRDGFASALDPDGSPTRLTVWIPLTNATPLNGCMYVVPWHLDEARGLAEEPPSIVLADGQLQSIRALPVPAGSVLAWHQGLLHWGGRASRLGQEPRMSVSVEFQRADRPTGNKLIAPGTVIPFRTRLGLIGTQISSYAMRFESCSPRVRMLAKALSRKYDRD